MDMQDVFQGSIKKYGKVNLNIGELRRIILSDYPYYHEDYTKKGKERILYSYGLVHIIALYKFMENKYKENNNAKS